MRGRVDEQEAQVPPAVAEARELRLAAARVVGDRQLPDRELGLGRPDHHLGGELHAGRAKLERGQLVAAEGAHAAVGVAHAGAEEEVEGAREDRVADVAVQPRHRAGLDPVHAVAHDEVGAGLELGQEARDLAEVVGQVGVRHQDVAALGGAEAGHVGVAVAAAALVDDAGAGGDRDRGAVVVGVVVGDDHLAVDAVLGHGGAGPGDAALDVRGLVEARDHDGEQRPVVMRREDFRVRGEKGLGDAHGWTWLVSVRRREWLSGARLPRLRLPLPPHRRRGRALVPQPGRAARRRRARGHVPHAAPVAARCGSGRAGGARGGGRPAARALYDVGAAADRAAAGVRARGPRASGAVRRALRRRPHRLVPLLQPARGGRCAPVARVPAGGRLARAVDARVLARLPRPGRRLGRLARAAGVRAHPPAGVLLLAPARGAARGRRGARRS